MFEKNRENYLLKSTEKMKILQIKMYSVLEETLGKSCNSAVLIHSFFIPTRVLSIEFFFCISTVEGSLL